MDDKMLQESRKKLSALDKQLSDLAIKQRTTEARLANEHDLIRKAASQRAGLVAQLIDAAPEQAAKIHKQIDGLDQQQIKSSERLAESLQNLLRSIATETVATTAERDRVNQLVGAENTSRAFQQWTVDMEANFKAATLAMAEARESLAKLTTEAARGVERFAGAAGGWAATRFDEWEHGESNPNQLLGFRPALPWFRSTIVHISPMTRA